MADRRRHLPQFKRAVFGAIIIQGDYRNWKGGKVMLNTIIEVLSEVGIICVEIAVIAIVFLSAYWILSYMYEEFNYIIVKKKCDTGWYYKYNKGFYEDLEEREK